MMELMVQISNKSFANEIKGCVSAAIRFVVALFPLRGDNIRCFLGKIRDKQIQRFRDSLYFLWISIVEIL